MFPVFPAIGDVNCELLSGSAQMSVMILETDLLEKPVIFYEHLFPVGS
jgi:hypothetical protein